MCAPCTHFFWSANGIKKIQRCLRGIFYRLNVDQLLAAHFLIKLGAIEGVYSWLGVKIALLAIV
jgi:hypothetical protein